MSRRWLIIVVAVVLLGAGAYLGFSYLAVNASPPDGADLAVEIPVEAGQEIIAEGRLIPSDNATAVFSTLGTVRQVLVAEGDLVAAGQDLVRLDARPLETKLEQAIAQAQAAQARLDLVKLAPDAIDLAAYQIAIQVAQANVQSAQGGVSSAQAQLARVSKPASAQEIAIAQHQIEQAKNARWAAQAQRDAICGRVGKGAQDSDCDAAQAGVQQAEEQVRITGLQLDQLLALPRAEEIAAARALLEQSEGQLAVAQAQVLQSQANYHLAAKGPSPEAIQAAQAEMAQAEAGVRLAQLALDDAVLRAPIAGSVIDVDMQVGQPVGPSAGSVRIADLSRWQVETTDLSELSVIQVKLGDRAMLRFDALPDAELEGFVTDISPFGELKRGEIAYTVTITARDLDPRLAWNMTAEVSIIPSKIVE